MKYSAVSDCKFSAISQRRQKDDANRTQERFPVNRKLAWTVLAAALAFGDPALAHHGLAEYDMTKTTTLKGTVTAFEWANPHAMVDMDVKTDAGVEKWQAETNSPNLLARAGWTRNSLKPGDQITVIGHASKKGTKLMRLVKIVFADGRVLNPGG
jgi:Family of unknown function (DUF6152)